MVLEASIGYAASCGVVVIDEVADLNERVDVRMEEVEENIGLLKGEVVELRNKLRELREAHGQLSCQVGELNTLVEDMCRHLHLPRTPEERVASRIEADLRAAERRRASTLVRFQGWLVPIGEPDRAQSPPREIIDLTDDSEDDVLDLSSEEEQQAREEEFRGVLTFHAEVECARADPAPEYEAPPGYDAPGPLRS